MRSEQVSRGKNFLRFRVTGREKILFIAWIVIVAVFITVVSLRNAGRQIVELDERIRVNQKRLTRLSGVAKSSVRIDAAYERIMQSLPQTAALEAFLAEITGTGQSAGFRISSIDPGEATDEEGVRVYPVTVEGRDRIANLARFLSALIVRFKAVDVRQVSARAASPEEPMDITVELRAASRTE